MTDQLPDIDLIIRQARKDRDAAIGAWLNQASHAASRWSGRGVHQILVLIASVASLLSRTGRA